MLRTQWRESMRQLFWGNVPTRLRTMSKRRKILWISVFVITAVDLAAIRFHLNLTVMVLSCVWASILWYVIDFMLADPEF